MSRLQFEQNPGLLRAWLNARGARIQDDADAVDTAQLAAAGIDPTPLGDTFSLGHVTWLIDNDLVPPLTPDTSGVGLLQEKIAYARIVVAQRIESLTTDARQPLGTQEAGRISDLAKALSIAGPEALDTSSLRALIDEARRALDAIRTDAATTTNASYLQRADQMHRQLRSAVERLVGVARAVGVRDVATRETVSAPLTKDEVLMLLGEGAILEPLEPARVSFAQSVTLRGSNGLSMRGIVKAGTPAAWKDALGISEEAFPKHEAATYGLADLLGIGAVVAETKLREVDGKTISVQRFITDGLSVYEQAGDEHPVDRAAFEKLRVLDYITGNWDRKDQNVLLVEGPRGLRPVGFDNAVSFVRPAGRFSTVRFETPNVDLPKDSLLDETIAFIRGIDFEAVHAFLRDAEIDGDAVALAVARLTYLKKDPTIVTLARRDDATRHLSKVDAP